METFLWYCQRVILSLDFCAPLFLYVFSTVWINLNKQKQKQRTMCSKLAHLRPIQNDDLKLYGDYVKLYENRRSPVFIVVSNVKWYRSQADKKVICRHLNLNSLFFVVPLVSSAVKCSLSLKLELDIGLQFMASECFAWKAFVSSQELQFPEFLDQNLNLFPVAQLIFFW